MKLARARSLAAMRREAPSLPGAARPSVAGARRAAAADFARLGLPSVRDEDWKYTSLVPLCEVSFVRAAAAAAAATLPTSALLPHVLRAKHLLLFVNGRLDVARSHTGDLPKGVVVTSLAAAAAGDTAATAAVAEGTAVTEDEAVAGGTSAIAAVTATALLEEHLGRNAPGDARGLVAENAALWADGALVHVAAGVAFDEPLHLVFVAAADGAAEPASTHVRNLIVAEPHSRVIVVEHYLSAAGVRYTNAVTEAQVRDGASLTHYKLEEEGLATFHWGSLDVSLLGGARFSSHVLAVGGRLARSEVHVGLDAEGAEARLFGLYLPGTGQLIDTLTYLGHHRPRCTSEELYKGVLRGDGRAVWTGRVFVAKDAQETSARQTNRNVLLSAGAHVDARPQLEIYADDVKCSHGAAIGRLDADALFYLRSRGIDEAEARAMLTGAFVSEIVASIPTRELRTALEQTLNAGILSLAANTGAL